MGDVIETIIKCFASTILLIDILGIFGNVNIITATLFFKQLRSSKCSLLILEIAIQDLISTSFGIQAFVYDMAHKHDHLIFLGECFRKIFIFVFIECYETFLILFLALDRLAAVSMPMFYNSVNPILYFIVINIPGILFGAVIVVLGFVHTQDDELIQFCIPPTSLNLHAQWVYTLSITVINSCTILVYVGIGAILWYKLRQNQVTNQQQVKITKTIAYIVVFFVLTWVSGHLISFIANVVFHGSMRRCLYHLLSMLPTHLNYAMNFYIYFWRNDTYRQIFKRQIKIAISKVFCGRCCVVSSSTWATSCSTVTVSQVKTLKSTTNTTSTSR